MKSVLSLSRRMFVRSGITGAVSGILARPMFGFSPGHRDTHRHLIRDHSRLDTLSFQADTDDLRALALRAIDAARAAGARYADVRVTRTVSQGFSHQDVVTAAVSDTEELAIGVRAWVDGYWGFAASPYWDLDEAAHLASEAVLQARTNAGSKTDLSTNPAASSPRPDDWTPIPAATGFWTTPGIDPWTISIEEKIDFMNAWRQAVYETRARGLTVAPEAATMMFGRQERFMASTDGAANAQTLYTSSGNFPLSMQYSDWHPTREQREVYVPVQGLHPQRSGWNVFLDARIRDQIPALIEEGRAALALAGTPVEIGRYDVVFDARATAELTARTFAIATQLDRALGFEANAGGTSYLGPDPLALLGRGLVAAPVVTLTANRSMPAGCATVQWDDEGVVPDEFALVKEGRLVDYQTTREQAAWLKPWYDSQQQPMRSHGCASSANALQFPLQHPPNLTVMPGSDGTSFETLVAGIPRGVAILGGPVSSDFQAKTGMGRGVVREIVNGKLGRVYQGAGFMFDARELWTSVTAMGDGRSARHTVIQQAKGQPSQGSAFTVSAVPLAAKQVRVIDAMRRA